MNDEAEATKTRLRWHEMRSGFFYYHGYTGNKVQERMLNEAFDAAVAAHDATVKEEAQREVIERFSYELGGANLYAMEAVRAHYGITPEPSTEDRR